MKSLLNLTVDTDVLVKAKQKIPNISKTVNGFLKELLEIGDKDNLTIDKAKLDMENQKVKYDALKSIYDDLMEKKKKEDSRCEVMYDMEKGINKLGFRK